MRIKKTINNNIVCAIDEKGSEMIVMGKGLGFKKKTGEFIDETLIEKTYHMENKAEQKRLRELVQQIPIEDLIFTEKLIEMIRTTINQPLNESLLITLADHISFALKRKREGIEFTNPLDGEILCYYPVEYGLGNRCLEEIEKEYQITLNKAEASFIALHIVNAELNTHMTQVLDMTRMMEGCCRVVESYYQKTFAKNSLGYSRFMIHLRYFSKRVLQDQLMPDKKKADDAEFRLMIARAYPKHFRCAGEIAAYIEKDWGKTLTGEEIVYLTIHLKRINDSEDEEDGETSGEV